MLFCFIYSPFIYYRGGLYDQWQYIRLCISIGTYQCNSTGDQIRRVMWHGLPNQAVKSIERRICDVGTAGWRGTESNIINNKDLEIY
jgi:hypothetical protein